MLRDCAKRLCLQAFSPSAPPTPPGRTRGRSSTRARCLAHGGELARRVGRRLLLARAPERLPHPFGHGHPVPAGELANLGELPLVQQDLEALTHTEQVGDSSV